MKTIVELFTSPTCPYCPAAKQVASESVGSLREKGEEIELNIFDVSTPIGSSKAREYGITHVPEMIIYADPAKKILIEGAASKEGFERAVRMCQGKEAIPQKRGFFSGLKSAFKL